MKNKTLRPDSAPIYSTPNFYTHLSAPPNHCLKHHSHWANHLFLSNSLSIYATPVDPHLINLTVLNPSVTVTSSLISHFANHIPNDTYQTTGYLILMHSRCWPLYVALVFLWSSFLEYEVFTFQMEKVVSKLLQIKFLKRTGFLCWYRDPGVIEMMIDNF